jgi:hypothetical protein
MWQLKVERLSASFYALAVVLKRTNATHLCSLVMERVEWRCKGMKN